MHSLISLDKTDGILKLGFLAVGEGTDTGTGFLFGKLEKKAGTRAGWARRPW